MFFSKSKNALPGKGVKEKLGNGVEAEYFKELTNINNWR